MVMAMRGLPIAKLSASNFSVKVRIVPPSKPASPSISKTAA